MASLRSKFEDAEVEQLIAVAANAVHGEGPDRLSQPMRDLAYRAYVELHYEPADDERRDAAMVAALDADGWAAAILRYADKIMEMVAEDVAAGKVPADVRSFGQLADHVDNNEYGIQAGVPYAPWDSATWRFHIGVVDEVTARLAAKAGPCEHPAHLQGEWGLLGCGYGCKVMRCDGCGTDSESHRAAYGCPQGR